MIISKILGLIVALAHVYFFVLESILYTKASGRKIFGLTIQESQATKVWALNQGYYNLFLALGLVFSIITNNQLMFVYLLIFVVMVGIVGALSVKPKIFWFQSFPAILALICFSF